MGVGIGTRTTLAPSVNVVASAVLLATLAEFLVGRLGVNAVATMPKEGDVIQLYLNLATAGAAVTRFAHLLTIGVTAFVAIGWLRQSVRSAALAVPLLALVQLSAVLLVWPPGLTLLLGFEVTFMVVLGMTLWRLARSSSTSVKLLAGLLAGTYAATTYFRAAPLVREVLRLPGLAPFAGEALAAAEALAVVTSAVVFVVFRSAQTLEERGAARWLIIPSILAAGFALAFSRAPWVTAVATTWTLGFSLWLPWPLYSVAIWLYAYTAVQLIAKRRWTGIGLVLVLLAGLVPRPPYEILLATLGLAWLIPDAGLSISGTRE